MLMPDSEAKKRWAAQNAYIMTVKLMRKTDSDVIEFLDGKNKRDTILEVVRFYLANHREEG